jgi:hypothetical protein
MEDPQYEYRKARYESYVKERETLRDSSLEISGRYDKSILFLSGGALALSLTFIEKIAPLPTAWTFVLLATAWLLLIASVVLELYALATSQTAINEQITILDAEYDTFLENLTGDITISGHHTPPARENRFTARTRRLNVWSLRFMVLGLGFLCLFSGINLPFTRGRHDMAEQTQKSRGSYVPPGNVRPPPPPPSPAPKPAPSRGSQK